MDENKTMPKIKLISNLIITIGVGAIVGNAVKFTTPATIGKITKACVGLGTMVLGGLASEACAKYANEAIDEGAEIVRDFKAAVEKIGEEPIDIGDEA